MKTQWQKEIEKLHQVELAHLQAIKDLEQHNIESLERDIRLFRVASFAAVACGFLVYLFV